MHNFIYTLNTVWQYSCCINL